MNRTSKFLCVFGQLRQERAVFCILSNKASITFRLILKISNLAGFKLTWSLHTWRDEWFFVFGWFELTGLNWVQILCWLSLLEEGLWLGINKVGEIGIELASVTKLHATSCLDFRLIDHGARLKIGIDFRESVILKRSGLTHCLNRLIFRILIFILSRCNGKAILFPLISLNTEHNDHS